MYVCVYFSLNTKVIPFRKSSTQNKIRTAQKGKNKFSIAYILPKKTGVFNTLLCFPAFQGILYLPIISLSAFMPYLRYVHFLIFLQ